MVGTLRFAHPTSCTGLLRRVAPRNHASAPPQFRADVHASSVIRNAGGVMASTTGYGRAVLLMLAAGVGMASVLPGRAQTVPSGENPEASATEAAAAPDADDADIRDLQLDW